MFPLHAKGIIERQLFQPQLYRYLTGHSPVFAGLFLFCPKTGLGLKLVSSQQEPWYLRNDELGVADYSHECRKTLCLCIASIPTILLQPKSSKHRRMATPA